MGSRGRSIRLRIYVLVAIPLVTMLGLFGYVAYSSVTNWLNLDRAPSLIQATSEPLTNFVNVLQAERRAAVVYLSKPASASLADFNAAVATTKQSAQQLAITLHAPATTNNSTPAETEAIDKMLGQLNDMTQLRAGVTAKKLAPLTALEDYTNVIAGQGAVLQAEAASIADAKPVLEGLGLISAVNTQEDMSEQDAILASALTSGTLTAADRVAFSQAAGRQQSDTLTYQQLLTPAELSTYHATLNLLAPKQEVQDNLATIQQAVPAGLPLSEMEAQGLNSDTWKSLTGTWLKASSKAGTDAATAVLAANQQPAIDAKRRVWITAAVGAAGLILTLLVTILLAQSINRRLAGLRRSALALAQEQLPAVVSRLRRGESVDVAAEAPPLRAGSDEIGQVGEAIDTVRQVAIRSAVEEAKVRQGVNDMFRSLARRNQSLLQRQLSVLDGMERRATDPDVLDDLFKMDHLTTRMRRHAEGLIILSGAAPGRSWSAPVKLIDVMRGAVAEVEDYARVTVTTQSRAALAGSAVTDVIHLLAELIENATTLSPPFTQVRVTGENVANGFAIEIEDRGLGMVPERMEELNERLANPPEINPANTEQLGLFVVGQLGRRHGIRVMLRPSPYGGTTAVALLPQTLIVEEGPAAITAGGAPATAGSSAGGGTAAGASPADGGAHASGAFASGGYANAGGNGNAAGSYADRDWAAFAGSGNNAGAGLNGNGYAGAGAGASRPPWSSAGERAPGGTAAAAGDPGAPGSSHPVPSTSGGRTDTGAPAAFGRPAPYGTAPYAGGSDPRPGDPAAPGYPAADPREARTRAPEPGLPGRTAGPDSPGVQVAGTLRPPAAPAVPGSSAPSGPADPGPGTSAPGYGPGGPASPDLPARRPGGQRGHEGVPVVTGVPVGRTATPAPEFDVFTPIRRPGQPPADAPQSSPYGPAHRPGGQPDNTGYSGAYPAAPTGGSPDGGTGSGGNASHPGPGHQAEVPAVPPAGAFTGGAAPAASASPAAGPAQPGPAQPGPAQPGPAQPGPAQPGPAQPGVASAGGGSLTGGHPYQDAPAFPGSGAYPAAVAYPGDGGGAGQPVPGAPPRDFPGGPGGPVGPADAAVPGDDGAPPGEADPAGDGPSEAGGDFKGLPRRVRQANLAPQLRSPATSGGQGSAVPRATAASLADMRNTLSAMQRGWQQGRSQVRRDTEGEPDGD